METTTSERYQLESPADRHEWAIERGKEHGASVHQQAVLVFIAFRVGPEGKAWWSLGKIAEQTRMTKNAVSKCLIWWVKEGVLKATPQLRSPTIYELAQYPVERDINPESSDESNIPLNVIQYPVERDPISRLTGFNIPSEHPLKELKKNGVNEQEKENTHSLLQDVQEHLNALAEPDREKDIREAFDSLPQWAESWPRGLEDAVPYYLLNWGAFKVDLLARVGNRVSFEHA